MIGIDLVFLLSLAASELLIRDHFSDPLMDLSVDLTWGPFLLSVVQFSPNREGTVQWRGTCLPPSASYQDKNGLRQGTKPVLGEMFGNVFLHFSSGQHGIQ